jgi:hypothetical protein
MFVHYSHLVSSPSFRSSTAQKARQAARHVHPFGLLRRVRCRRWSSPSTSTTSPSHRRASQGCTFGHASRNPQGSLGQRFFDRGSCSSSDDSFFRLSSTSFSTFSCSPGASSAPQDGPYSRSTSADDFGRRGGRQRLQADDGGQEGGETQGACCGQRQRQGEEEGGSGVSVRRHAV